MMGKAPISVTSSSFVSPSEGSKPKTGDVSSAFRQPKEKDSSSPFRETSSSFAPVSSKSDSWVKGGGTGSFDGPEAPSRKKTSYGSGPSGGA